MMDILIGFHLNQHPGTQSVPHMLTDNLPQVCNLRRAAQKSWLGAQDQVKWQNYRVHQVDVGQPQVAGHARGGGHGVEWDAGHLSAVIFNIYKPCLRARWLRTGNSNKSAILQNVRFYGSTSNCTRGPTLPRTNGSLCHSWKNQPKLISINLG